MGQGRCCVRICRLPFVIRRPGRYCLGRDLTWSQAGAAITVEPQAQHDVTIDGRGRRLLIDTPISGDTPFKVFGVLAQGPGLSRVTVRDLFVESTPVYTFPGAPSNGHVGIQASDVDTLHVERYSNTGSQFALSLSRCSDVIVRHDSFLNNLGPGFAGVSVLLRDGDTDVTIEDCSIRVTVPVTQPTSPDDTTFLGPSGILTGDPQFGLVHHHANVTMRRLTIDGESFPVVVAAVNVLLMEDIGITQTGAPFEGVQIGGDDIPNPCTNAVIRNVRLSFTDSTVQAYDGILFFNGSNALMENCVFDARAVPDAADPTAAPVHISAPSFVGAGGWVGLTMRQCAVKGASQRLISVDQAQDVTIDSVRLDLPDSVATGTGIGSFAFGPSRNLVVRRCQIFGGGATSAPNRQTGISLQRMTGAVIEDNSILGCGQAGIAVESSSRNVVMTRNVLVRNGGGPTQIVDRGTDDVQQDNVTSPAAR